MNARLESVRGDLQITSKEHAIRVDGFVSIPRMDGVLLLIDIVQARGCHLVASSPEILTHFEGGILTNRPLGGTRRRGTTKEEDEIVKNELLADEKDRSEHMMLVDLERNDIGRVSEYGTVIPERLMQVEKYSHVMHISSTVKGTLREGLTSWDAIRSTLPAGTISGAPKIRLMQIIDELEPTKRGPYGGGIVYISFHDTMNIALALRTMVVRNETRVNEDGRKEWRYFLQAGAGIVYESDPEAEYTETMNKAMALSRATDLAENAFLADQ
ncbi:anthranilate synthase component I [Gracilaria domingensis]|nr:anthranilate synthase component I [Gracilaria domingensis]